MASFDAFLVVFYAI